MKDSYAKSLEEVLKHEGGFVNDPLDSGGATNRGITQQVYDDWRISQGLPKRSVRYINDYEVGKIYRAQYWDKCCCDDLPAGVDYAVFDFAINSGVNRASRFLQRIAAVTEDGRIGPMTVNAVRMLQLPATIIALCNARQKFLESLKTFAHFGKGWTQRVQEVKILALQMAGAINAG